MEILIFLFVLGAGVAAGYFFRRTMAKRDAETAEARVDKMITDAREKQREIIIEGKNKALEILEKAKLEEDKRRGELRDIQRRLEKRETLFDQKLLEFEDKRNKLAEKEKNLEVLKEDLRTVKQKGMEKLEKISQLTQAEAKEVLIKNIESAVKDELYQRVRKLEKENSEELEEKAKRILSNVIERCATSHSADTTTTTVTLPNDEMKGRIIGKEGRNIKTIEQLTGTELVIDETPGTIWVSGFSPIRRQVAKVALEKLMADGRIHPGRIEEAIEAAKKDLAIEIKKAGEEAMYQVGVGGLDPKLVQILGRLYYRTSYGQNVLQHSMEVALIAETIAEEIGANAPVAKRAGLFHDIGKALDQQMEGSHIDIGIKILEKFGEKEEIIHAMRSHHGDFPVDSLEGAIVIVADSISASRPGARKDTLENYLQRLGALETIANRFEGVDKAYAIQAGREIRVFVKADKVDDLGVSKMARHIAANIEEELKYPGEIKVTVIRENRVVEYAR